MDQQPRRAAGGGGVHRGENRIPARAGGERFLVLRRARKALCGGGLSARVQGRHSAEQGVCRFQSHERGLGFHAADRARK